jgi:hypothetical protein
METRLTRLWYWLLSFFPKKVIAGECPQLCPWMTRYVLYKKGRLGASVFLHHIHRSDESRTHLHDHPWPFVAIILKCGYYEEARWPEAKGKTSYRWFGPLSILRRRAEWSHRLELKPGTEAWSLVFVGRTVRTWGFHTEGGWVPWMKYDYKNLICPED